MSREGTEQAAGKHEIKVEGGKDWPTSLFWPATKACCTKEEHTTHTRARAHAKRKIDRDGEREGQGWG